MDLKEMLLKENIVKVNGEHKEPFTLKSGKKSRLFIDIKQASLNPTILKEVIMRVIEVAPAYIYGYDKIASVAIGGIPIATALSLETEIPQVIIRSEKHDTGTKSQIIGDVEDQHCILIEDVATTGGSLINAVRAIRDANGICKEVIVVVDREEGAKELCEENDIKLYSCLKKSDFGLLEEL